MRNCQKPPFWLNDFQKARIADRRVADATSVEANMFTVFHAGVQSLGRSMVIMVSKLCLPEVAVLSKTMEMSKVVSKGITKSAAALFSMSLVSSFRVAVITQWPSSCCS